MGSEARDRDILGGVEARKVWRMLERYDCAAPLVQVEIYGAAHRRAVSTMGAMMLVSNSYELRTREGRARMVAMFKRLLGDDVAEGFDRGPELEAQARRLADYALGLEYVARLNREEPLP